MGGFTYKEQFLICFQMIAWHHHKSAWEESNSLQVYKELTSLDFLAGNEFQTDKLTIHQKLPQKKVIDSLKLKIVRFVKTKSI